ncbi:MAG: hypothetical protein ACI4ET_15610 [Bilifractor sp.]
MKKIMVSVLLAGTMAVALTGCGKDTTGSLSQTTGTAANTATASAQVSVTSGSSDGAASDVTASNSESVDAASPATSSSTSSDATVSSSKSAETETEALTAVAVSSDDTDDSMVKSFDDVLDTCTSWGVGTAGSSLNSMISAVSLMTWANDNDVQNMDQDKLLSIVQKSYAKLDDTQKSEFAANWRTLYDTGDSILNDPSDLYAIMDDAGCYDAGVAIVQNGDSVKNWETLKLLIENNIF